MSTTVWCTHDNFMKKLRELTKFLKKFLQLLIEMVKISSTHFKTLKFESLIRNGRHQCFPLTNSSFRKLIPSVSTHTYKWFENFRAEVEWPFMEGNLKIYANFLKKFITVVQNWAGLQISNCKFRPDLPDQLLQILAEIREGKIDERRYLTSLHKSKIQI